MKIRDRIIRMFGGHTQEEYDKLCGVADMPVPIARIERKIWTVSARNKYNRTYVPDAYEYVKKDLVRNISAQLVSNNLIGFSTKEPEEGKWYTEVRATLKVVAPWEGDT